MERYASLDQLPDGLTFPDSHADRIRYDANARRLAYRGFMSKADFDRLYQIHPSWAYRRALEDLFRACSLAETSTTAGPLSRLLGVFGGSGRRAGLT